MKKYKYPTRHEYGVGDEVRFHFAGSVRIGQVVELTFEGEHTIHATYTVQTSNGMIYPCLGLLDSKDIGNILCKKDEYHHAYSKATKSQ